MPLTDLLSKILRDCGITVFFGIPGIHNLPFYRALHADGHKLITVRHEQSAAFMADGFARASGMVAGTLLIDGPGFLNAATAIAQARADSVPMVVLTPCGTDAATGKLHELPGQATVAKEITRAHIRLSNSSNSVEIVEYLQQKLHQERPGPVHIEVPLALLDREIEDLGDWQEARKYQYIEHEKISQAADVIKKSERPAIVVGGGTVHAQQELVAFAEMIDAPVVNTTNAKGILPHGHRLKVGYSPSFPEVRSLLRAADVVIAFGTELGETDFDFFLTNEELDLQYLIRVDIELEQLQTNADANIAIQGDSQRALQELLKKDLRRKSDGSECSAVARKSVQQNKYFNNHLSSFFQVVQEQTDVLVGDSSQPNYYAQLMYEPKSVRGYFHSVTGFGTLGYSIPAAIGAKIGKPNSNVACLVGDGGAAFTLSELQTASQLNLGIPFIVWNNHGYEEIDKAMRTETEDQYYSSPTPPNFALLAQSFSMKYQQPKNLAEFTDTLHSAYLDSSPIIIEILDEDFVPSNTWVNWFEEENH